MPYQHIDTLEPVSIGSAIVFVFFFAGWNPMVPTVQASKKLSEGCFAVSDLGETVQNFHGL